MPERLATNLHQEGEIDTNDAYRDKISRHMQHAQEIWRRQNALLDSEEFRAVEQASRDDDALATLDRKDLTTFLDVAADLFVRYQEINAQYTQKALSIPDEADMGELTPELDELQTIADQDQQQVARVRQIVFDLCRKLSNDMTTFPPEHFDTEDIYRYLRVIAAPGPDRTINQTMLGITLLENYTAQHPELITDDRFYEFGDEIWKQQQIDAAVRHLFPQPDEVELIYESEDIPHDPKNLARWRQRADEAETRFHNILKKAVADTDVRYGEYVHQCLTEQIGPYMEEIGTAWLTYTPNPNRPMEAERDRFRNIIMQHFKNMRAIWRETGQSGLESLHKDYGLCHFGYYPEQLLLDQAHHEPVEQPDKRYLTAIYPFDDHNGAGFGGKTALSQAYEDLHQTHHIVVAETKHRFGLMRRLHTIQNRYGGNESISPDALIIFAHGNSETIFLDPHNADADRTTLKKQSFTESRPTPGVDHLLGESPIVLVSCSTGAPDGIAATASKFFKRPITAPAVATNIKDYGASVLPDGTASLQPTYFKNEQNTYAP